MKEKCSVSSPKGTVQPKIEYRLHIFFLLPYPSRLLWCDLLSFGDSCLLSNIMDLVGTLLVVLKVPGKK